MTGDFDRISLREAMAGAVKWFHALALQANRVEKARLLGFGNVERDVDFEFYVVALRRLLYAIDVVKKLLTSKGSAEVRRALNEFDRAVPGAKDLRDHLEHLGDYELGEGHLQGQASERGVDSVRPLVWFEYQPGRNVVTVTTTHRGTLTLDLNDASDAANRLMVATETAVASAEPAR